jgi:hypothetical protein
LAFFAWGRYNYLARRMQEHLAVLVLVAGHILDSDQADATLAAGDCVAPPHLYDAAAEGARAEATL